MKLHYIGVCFPLNQSLMEGLALTDRYLQIIKNESKPAHELCAEKELSTYSRFTRNKCVCHRRI